MDDIVRFGKAKAEAVLSVLNADTQQCEDGGQQYYQPDLSPPLGQQRTAKQTGRIEENYIHKVGSIDLVAAAVESVVLGIEWRQNGVRQSAALRALAQGTEQNDSDPADA